MSLTSIYVGNLPYAAKEEDLIALFAPYGEVARATLITDKTTGRPRGIAFVEMPDLQAARRAIEALSGKEFLGRPLTINEARNTHARGSGNTSLAAKGPPQQPAHTPPHPTTAAPSSPASAPATEAAPTRGGYHNKMRGV